VNALITLVASAATGAFVLLGPGFLHAVSSQPGELVVFAGLAVALQLAAVEIYGRGALSFSGMGILATGFALGPGAGMVAAILVAAVNMVVQQGRLDRAAFNAANLSLSAAAAAGAYHVLGTPEWTTAARLVPAFLAGVLFMVVNIGLLSLAMSLAEGLPMQAIWRERFRWFTPYYLVSGPLALATTVAFEEAGLIGMLAFGLPPAIMMLSIRQYISRTRDSVAQVRQANDELQLANADLKALFAFTGGPGRAVTTRAPSSPTPSATWDSCWGSTSASARRASSRGFRSSPAVATSARSCSTSGRSPTASGGSGSRRRSSRSSRPRSRAPR
jgi:hypothetical protein